MLFMCYRSVSGITEQCMLKMINILPVSKLSSLESESVSTLLKVTTTSKIKTVSQKTKQNWIVDGSQQPENKINQGHDAFKSKSKKHSKGEETMIYI